MEKVIDLNKKVYDLVKEYPEIKGIMIELGFKDITNDDALNLMGKIMTIPKGAAIKRIPMDKIKETFKNYGFTINGEEVQVSSELERKDDLLKSYILRLNAGEDLESVRKDFVEKFESVSVHEIIDVEQGLIDSGMDVEEVQKLCDLHSALFHGKTEAEIYLEEEKELNQLDKGHPIEILKAENRGLEKKLNELSLALDENNVSKVQNLLEELKKIKTLYGKKEELIMPILYRYGVKGPSDVMWGVDDEIKAEYHNLAKEVNNELALTLNKQRILDVVERSKEMIYKEENILFPMAFECFSEEEWIDVYGDIDEMGSCFVESYEKWDKAEEILSQRKKHSNMNDGMLELQGGKLSIKELEALFKLLPVDITFIDVNENNQFFANEGKVFSRPSSALGRPVYECHPPRIVPMVQELIRSFKAGEKDHMEVWTPNPDNPIRVIYHAVKDEEGNYLGTVELVQQFKEMKKKLKEII